MRHFSLIVTVIHGINEHGTLNIGSAGKTNKIITTYGFNSLKLFHEKTFPKGNKFSVDLHFFESLQYFF